MRLSISLAVLAVLLFGCRKDRLFTDSPVSLEFSQAEVLFDTVFTQNPFSVTKRFRVRNPDSKGVRVDIALQGGGSSPFRINVDGAAGTVFEDVEISGGDSIYVFVEASLDQSNQNAPLIHEDRIRFSTNGSEQEVKLVAWGQDAHYYRPTSYPQGLPAYGIIAAEGQTVTWPNDKPYVIYGYAAVDSTATLIIEPGVRVFVHGGGGLWIYRSGRLLAEGTVQAPITFQSDRREALYAELPGQWDRIWINEGPAGADHVMTNVVVKNALVGIQCETWPGLTLDGIPTDGAWLNLTNVKIRNCSAAGILSRNYRIRATNLLVGDCGQYGLALTGGGAYAFNQVTVANYWNYSVRNTPSVVMTNTHTDYTGATGVFEIPSSTFQNSIVHGANANEFQLDFNALSTPSLSLLRMMVRTDQTIANAYVPDPNTLWRNQDPGFRSIANRDFHLAAGSFARNRSISTPPPATSDLDGVDRGQDGQYDLGCYEYVP
jgi:hypothetical protein